MVARESHSCGPLSRRELLARGGVGLGAMALASLLSADEGRRPDPLAPRRPHFRAKAKRVLHLFANGGPSQVDTFDPKPMPAKYEGKPLPKELHRMTQNRTGNALPSPFRFPKCGRSGIEISEIFPRLAECADELCVIRSTHADFPFHDLSIRLMNCGENRQVRPSMGSWVTYGLGTESRYQESREEDSLIEARIQTFELAYRMQAGVLEAFDEQRGMLEDTLVVWGGEFGRTPSTEGANGRDHDHWGFSMWLAGGGVKAGHVHGATDDFGFAAVEKPVHVHDLHATILHLLGFDHEKLTYRYAGRDFRLTDVRGQVVKQILD